ncbi:hypothetical protein HMPREF2826_01720 [Olsenella sp. HMSC062G07]|nr:hypothetical protein HMPREF2826_01720 [Olsenella sp. HMSC062G07]
MGIGTTYLPIGSVVELKGGERPLMVAAVMARDGNSGRLWDYMGYPYPEGRRDVASDYFFDGDMIESLLHLGYFNDETMAFQSFLAEQEGEYRRQRKESRGEDRS